MTIPMIFLCIVIVILVYLLYRSERDFANLMKIKEALADEIDRLRSEVK